MATVKCPNCGHEITDDEPLAIRGIAKVGGTASLRDFHDGGAVWEPLDSWGEEFRCPCCGEYFAPDFVELRGKWKEEEKGRR